MIRTYWLPLAAIFLTLVPLASAASLQNPTLVQCGPGSGTYAALDIAACIEGQAISTEALNGLISTELRNLEEQAYQLRRRALERLIAQRLLAQISQNEGVPLETIVERNTQPVTEEDIARVLSDNRARFQGIPEFQAVNQVKNGLAQQRQQQAYQQVLKNLRESRDIRIYLSRPAVDTSRIVADGAPASGAKDAPITLVQFFDFQCPFCKRSLDTLELLRVKYKDKIRFVQKHFPLPSHPDAMQAAEASLCAEDQGQFWEYHDQVFATTNRLSTDELKRIASDIGLNEAVFNQCLESGTNKNRVQADIENGQSLGVQATPTFFLNGQVLRGAQPISEFEIVIEQILNGNGK